jgi:hypothetical protein
MAERYRWYEVVNGADLEQGDLLFNCPVLVAASDVPFPIPTDDVPGTVLALDVIILTQSCDLAQNKISEVILCPHSDLADASRINPALSRTEAPRSLAEKSFSLKDSIAILSNPSSRLLTFSEGN